MPILVDEFEGSSLASIAFIPSLLYGISTGAGPVASALINRYGFRTVTMSGAVLSAIGLGISAAANSILFLYISVGVVTGIFAKTTLKYLLFTASTRIDIDLITFESLLYLSIGIGFGLINLPCIMPVLMYFEKKRALATGIALCGAGKNALQNI